MKPQIVSAPIIYMFLYVHLPYGVKLVLSLACETTRPSLYEDKQVPFYELEPTVKEGSFACHECVTFVENYLPGEQILDVCI